MKNQDRNYTASNSALQNFNNESKGYVSTQNLIEKIQRQKARFIEREENLVGVVSSQVRPLQVSQVRLSQNYNLPIYIDRNSRIQRLNTDDSSCVPTVKNTYTLISPKSEKSLNKNNRVTNLAKTLLKNIYNDQSSELEDICQDTPEVLNFDIPDNYEDYDEDYDCILKKHVKIADTQAGSNVNNESNFIQDTITKLQVQSDKKNKIKLKIDQLRHSLNLSKTDKLGETLHTLEQSGVNLEKIEEEPRDNEDEKEGRLGQIMLKATHLLGKNHLTKFIKC